MKSITATFKLTVRDESELIGLSDKEILGYFIQETALRKDIRKNFDGFETIDINGTKI